MQHEFFPLSFEGLHVFFSQDRFEGDVAGGIAFAVGDELTVEPNQQAFLLEKITEISSLGVILAVTGAGASAVKLLGRHGREFLKRNRLPFFNVSFQFLEAPVYQTSNVPI